ncbi:hypothetical protein [Streptomyces atratus]|uniref:hypothetical protein n=1 Tax=Streptomyces atratus TaxID=1893 RepID=UPI002F911255
MADTQGPHNAPPVSYKKLAETALGQAAAELSGLPIGRVDALEAQFHVAKAQAIATIAVAQALIEIGDVLRTAFEEAGGGAPQETHRG